MVSLCSLYLLYFVWKEIGIITFEVTFITKSCSCEAVTLPIGMGRELISWNAALQR